MEQTCKKGHLIFNNRCRACHSIKKEWYSYLEESGFTDIEISRKRCDRTDLLDLSDKTQFQTQTAFYAEKTYYQWASEKASTAKFNSITDRLIWECHSEGISRRDIAPRVGLEGSWVSRRIQKIRKQLETVGHIVSTASFQVSTYQL